MFTFLFIQLHISLYTIVIASKKIKGKSANQDCDCNYCSFLGLMFCTLIDLLPVTILKHVMAIVVVGYAQDMRSPMVVERIYRHKSDLLPEALCYCLQMATVAMVYTYNCCTHY